MEIIRRRIIAAGGTGLVGVGVLAYRWARRRSRPDHVVVVGSNRETTHEVTVETAFHGETQSFGPREVRPGDHWEVTRFTERGELTVRFDLDGERAWEDTHEIPTLSGDRSSIVVFELDPDDEIFARVKVEE